MKASLLLPCAIIAITFILNKYQNLYFFLFLLGFFLKHSLVISLEWPITHCVMYESIMYVCMYSMEQASICALIFLTLSCVLALYTSLVIINML